LERENRYILTGEHLTIQRFNASTF